MATYAVDPRASVLTGVPGLLQARGVPIQVTGWFKGPGAAAVVWLSAGSFGDEGASCERTPPTAGLEFIFVLYMPEDGSDPSGSICTPMAGLIGVEGKAMLADALATFGAPMEPFGQQVPPGEPVDELAALAPAIALIALGAGLLALVIVGLTKQGSRRSGGAGGMPGAD